MFKAHEPKAYGGRVRKVRFLLRPGWIILAMVVAAFAYLCFTVLAPWQLGKNERTSHRNDLIRASLDAEPVALANLTNGDGFAADTEWRRVTVSGRYHGEPLLVRLRAQDGNPGYEVLSVFVPDTGRAVLVNRGFTATAPGGAAPPSIAAPPAGHLTIEGRVRRSEGTAPGKDPLEQDGYRQVYSIDAGQAAALTNTPLLAGYLQLSAGQPGVLTPIPLPQMDSGPYLSYGLQWLAFGIMAPLGLAYFVRAEWLQRRATATAPAPPEPDATSAARPSQHLADRYGEQR